MVLASSGGWGRRCDPIAGMGRAPRHQPIASTVRLRRQRRTAAMCWPAVPGSVAPSTARCQKVGWRESQRTKPAASANVSTGTVKFRWSAKVRSTPSKRAAGAIPPLRHHWPPPPRSDLRRTPGLPPAVPAHGPAAGRGQSQPLGVPIEAELGELAVIEPICPARSGGRRPARRSPRGVLRDILYLTANARESERPSTMRTR